MRELIYDPLGKIRFRIITHVPSHPWYQVFKTKVTSLVIRETLTSESKDLINMNMSPWTLRIEVDLYKWSSIMIWDKSLLVNGFLIRSLKSYRHVSYIISLYKVPLSRCLTSNDLNQNRLYQILGRPHLQLPIKESINFNLLLLTYFIHRCDLNSLVLIQDHILKMNMEFWFDIILNCSQ